MIVENEGKLFLNPGSITLPKENSPHSYGSFENGYFIIKDIDGNIILQKNLID